MSSYSFSSHMGEVLAKAIFLGTECGSRPFYFISRIWGTCASNGIHDWGMECTGASRSSDPAGQL